MTTDQAMQNIELAIRKEVKVSVEIAEALLQSLSTIKVALAEKKEDNNTK